MTIQLELTDGTICRVVPKGLDFLLNQHQVRRFRRQSGWVVVGCDPIRSVSASNKYHGPERRQVF